MEDLPLCEKCNIPYGVKDGNDLCCIECGHIEKPNIKIKIKECQECGELAENFITDRIQASVICPECGDVQKTSLISEESENNYKDAFGNSQTVSRTSGQNDYATSFQELGTCLPSGLYFQDVNKNGQHYKKKMPEYYKYVGFNSQQKSYWQVSRELQEACDKGGIPKSIQCTANKFWEIIIESKVLKRGSNRRGMIGCCLEYACKKQNNPMNKSTIAHLLNIDKADITKGDKIFREIIGQKSEYKELLSETTESNSLYYRYCGILNIPFVVEQKCQEIDNSISHHLIGMAPRSIAAGIICYVIKDQMKYKKPTKSEISTKIGVCTPTLNKAIAIIKKNL